MLHTSKCPPFRVTPVLSASAPKVPWERAMGTGPQGLAVVMELDMVAPLTWPRQPSQPKIWCSYTSMFYFKKITYVISTVYHNIQMAFFYYCNNLPNHLDPRPPCLKKVYIHFLVVRWSGRYHHNFMPTACLDLGKGFFNQKPASWMCTASLSSCRGLCWGRFLGGLPWHWVYRVDLSTRRICYEIRLMATRNLGKLTSWYGSFIPSKFMGLKKHPNGGCWGFLNHQRY